MIFLHKLCCLNVTHSLMHIIVIISIGNTFFSPRNNPQASCAVPPSSTPRSGCRPTVAHNGQSNVGSASGLPFGHQRRSPCPTNSQRYSTKQGGLGLADQRCVLFRRRHPCPMPLFRTNKRLKGIKVVTLHVTEERERVISERELQRLPIF